MRIYRKPLHDEEFEKKLLELLEEFDVSDRTGIPVHIIAGSITHQLSDIEAKVTGS